MNFFPVHVRSPAKLNIRLNEQCEFSENTKLSVSLLFVKVAMT